LPESPQSPRRGRAGVKSQHHPATPPLGVHVSAAGGLDRGVENGARLGCDCLQVFVKNQRQWRAPHLDDNQITAFAAAVRTTGIEPVIAHASYLVNMASPEPAMRKRSARAMLDEITRCEALAIPMLVVHPGSAMNGTPKEAIRRIAQSIDRLHEATIGYRTKLLLETTAGQGSSIGHQFDQLRAIIDRLCEPERIGICLDTCHMFAAGHDFRSEADYHNLMELIDGTLGLGRVACIHLNDSKRDLGSRVDRHEHIGKGKIGMRGFAHFINDVRLAHVPMILETPKGTNGRGTDLDRVNLRRLRALRG
jgi:deoxyribonuclease-4